MKTANEVLNVIREFMLSEETEYTERRALWNVLTALRGPDTGIHGISDKLAATAVIRNHVFGHALTELIAADVRTDTPDYVERRKIIREKARQSGMFDHFYYHANWAFDSLGLKWDEVNLTEKELEEQALLKNINEIANTPSQP